MSLATISQAPQSAPIHTFFILQVYDGRGVYGFGLGLTDKALAHQMLDAFAHDLLGRRVELVSLPEMPSGNAPLSKHAAHTCQIKLLMDRCSIEPAPGRAFLVAYVQQYKRVMPLSQMSSMLEHAKYEPDHDRYAFIPLHESAIGRAYP